jgi:hypothetical protein
MPWTSSKWTNYLFTTLKVLLFALLFAKGESINSQGKLIDDMVNRFSQHPIQRISSSAPACFFLKIFTLTLLGAFDVESSGFEIRVNFEFYQFLFSLSLRFFHSSVNSFCEVFWVGSYLCRSD